MIGASDWYKESSVYQHFREEAVAEGRAAGRVKGAFLLLVIVIESRFGAMLPELRTALGHCPLEVLLALAPVAATCPSIEAFGEAVGAVATA